MNSGQTHRFVLFLILLALAAALIPAPVQSLQNPLAFDLVVRSQAEHGDPVAQYQLASSILASNPSPAEVQEALKWLRAAAEQDNSDAEFVLGYVYEHGKGVSRDLAAAFQNYSAAAAQGHPGAANNLASLYQNGLGVPRNLRKALEWYLASAEHGDPIAQCNLAGMYYAGSGTPRDTAQALHWLRAAAKSSLPEAQLFLAYCYFYGIAVPRDYEQTAQLVRLAARAGLPEAETSMGFLYEHGKGVPLDYVAAYTWYSRAIAGGDRDSMELRRQLMQVMTSKQINDAGTLLAVSPGPAPLPASAASNSATFSLFRHQSTH